MFSLRYIYEFDLRSRIRYDIAVDLPHSDPTVLIPICVVIHRTLRYSIGVICSDLVKHLSVDLGLLNRPHVPRYTICYYAPLHILPYLIYERYLITFVTFCPSDPHLCWPAISVTFVLFGDHSFVC